MVNQPLLRSIDWDLDEFSEFDPEDFALRTSSTVFSGPNDAFVGVRWPERLPEGDTAVED